MEKEQHTHILEALFDKTTDYLETRAELAKLKAIRKTSEVVSGIVSRVILAMFLFMFLIVLNIGAGFWLGELMGKIYYGFFALAAFYLIVGLIIYSGRNKWLKAPVADSLIKKINS